MSNTPEKNESLPEFPVRYEYGKDGIWRIFVSDTLDAEWADSQFSMMHYRHGAKLKIYLEPQEGCPAQLWLSLPSENKQARAQNEQV